MRGLALVTSLTIGGATTGMAQSPGSRDDEEAIDGDLVTVRGERFKGTAEYEKGLAAILATRAKEATLRTLDVTIRFIRPDVAVAHVTNELSGLIGPDGQKLPAHRELSIRVFVKDASTWRVAAAFHNTMLRPFGS
jgi:uncharacterized protein (TIGR02246 family)